MNPTIMYTGRWPKGPIEPVEQSGEAPIWDL